MMNARKRLHVIIVRIRKKYGKSYEEQLKSCAGFTLLDALGALLVGLVVISVVSSMINSTFSNSKISETEQNLIALRMQIQQLYSGQSNYDGLDNALAIQSGIAPKVFIKGADLGNAWGGTVTLESVPADAAFSIQFTGIPQNECTKLSLFQSEAWLSVTVNGSVLGEGLVNEAADACSTSNMITFVTR